MSLALLRPADQKDLSQLITLIQFTTPGLTSLSKDKDMIEKKLKQSIDSFNKDIKMPGNEFYWFVLELNKQIIGCSGIWSATGIKDIFYSYKIIPEVRTSKQLSHTTTLQTLKLTKTKNGPSEIGSLFLHPDYRKIGVGRLLSLGRFLFIASHPKRFKNSIIAEIRGQSDQNGKSPFWDSLGKKFFNIPFTQADYLSSKNKKFIPELMPTHPIYARLLTKKARNAIGKVHNHTIPAWSLLKSEGFSFKDEIDIFDGGPKLVAKQRKIRSIKHLKSSAFQKASTLDKQPHSYLISNHKTKGFRACLSALEVENNQIGLPSTTISILNLKTGDKVSYVKKK